MKEITVKHDLLPLLPKAGGVYLISGGYEVNTVTMGLAATYLLTGERVYWVDGGNAFNPYHLTEAAKRLCLDPGPLLKRLFVARAFTVYQLDALIAKRLEPDLKKHPKALGIIFDPLKLFLDPDVAEPEAKRVLQSISRRIRHLKERGYRLIVINPDHESQALERNNLLQIIRQTATRIYALRLEEDSIRLIEDDSLVIR